MASVARAVRDWVVGVAVAAPVFSLLFASAHAHTISVLLLAAARKSQLLVTISLTSQIVSTTIVSRQRVLSAGFLLFSLERQQLPSISCNSDGL